MSARRPTARPLVALLLVLAGCGGGGGWRAEAGRTCASGLADAQERAAAGGGPGLARAAGSLRTTARALRGVEGGGTALARVAADLDGVGARLGAYAGSGRPADLRAALRRDARLAASARAAGLPACARAARAG